MTAVIIYSSGNTQRPFSVAVTVAERAKESHSNVILLDIEKFTYIHQGLPPSWYARLIGRKVFPGNFEKRVAELDVKHEVLQRATRRINQRALAADVSDELEDAIKSDLFTYLRTDRIDDYPLLAGYTAQRLREAAGPLFHTLVEYLETNQVATLYIPNGRVAHQRISIRAGIAAKCAIKYYENGRAIPNSAYIGDCQIHDRASTQIEARNFAMTVPRPEKRQKANEWLSRRRMPGSKLNQFSREWRKSNDLGEDNDSRETRAVFFSSSTDEFSSYGSAWASNGWRNQYEAFSAILAVLTSRGVKCSLRIHPNLVNKSRKYVFREISSIQDLARNYPELQIFWHTDPANSYDLVEKSEYVVVGRSTLGLEASLMGKSVWTTTPSRYDQIADVRPLLSQSQVTDDYLTPWAVDPRGAQDFVAYWASQDFPFKFGEEEWCDWDTQRTNLSLKIANLLLPNSIVHKGHSIRCELGVVIRNSRRRNPRWSPNVCSSRDGLAGK